MARKNVLPFSRTAIQGPVAEMFAQWASMLNAEALGFVDRYNARALSQFGVYSRTDTVVNIGGIPGSLVDTVWVYDKLVKEPGPGETVEPRLTSADSPATILDASSANGDGFWTYAAAYPPAGYDRYLYFVPMDVDGVEGRTEVFALYD